MARFKDRISAGRELVPLLEKFRGDSNTLVIGLPRGGIVTAFEIAKGLSLPLGFLVVKKIGAPGDLELAIGAVTDNGGYFIDNETVSSIGVSESYVKSEIEKQREEARKRLDEYSSHFSNPSMKDKTVIVVDDGIATGATMIAAIRSVKKHGARKVIIAVPAGACEFFDKIRKEADEIVCLGEDLKLSAVGEYYDEFPEVTDEEVMDLLKNAKNNINDE